MSKTAKRILIATLFLAIAILVATFIAARHFAAKLEPELRSRVIQYLEQRFHSKVTLASLKIHIPSISPIGLLLRGGTGTTAHVEGQDITLRYQGREDVPPLFTVHSFTFDLDLGKLRQAQPQIPNVTLDGMTIVLPPKAENAPKPPNPSADPSPAAAGFLVEHLDVTHARLTILPKRADAKPLDFELQTIHLSDAGVNQQMTYQAMLFNPRPPGEINSHGTFGPWSADSPGDTKLEGDYEFSKADLGVFKAIGGTLHSTGHFVGTLAAVRVHGEATVPDFRLQTSGNRVPLSTQFDALVDGLNGNTVLQPVHARLRGTVFQTSGGIIKHELNGLRAIDLDVIMPNGHIEDLLSLATKGTPVMSGLIRMNAKISIPAFAGTVQQKLFLDGKFDIAQGEFLKDEVQKKIDELSRRGQGRPGDQTVGRVFSSMSGVFRLEDQVLTFSQLSFAVPGADVGLHGNYRMADDTVDFHGNLKLQATVSQTLTGWKRWLAKPFNRFFEKDGAGTFLKIQVVGNAAKPEFGLDHGAPK